MSCTVVLVTAKDSAEAARIARSLVELQLAACCNIVPGVRSIYRWQGEVEESSEVLMVIKTRRELFQALADEVRRLHSYSVPEIIALPIEAGYPEYLKWLGDSTKESLFIKKPARRQVSL